jgi:hypothetical protein
MSFFEVAGSFDELFRSCWKLWRKFFENQKAFHVCFLFFFVNKTVSFSDMVIQAGLGLSPEVTFEALEVVRPDVDLSMLKQLVCRIKLLSLSIAERTSQRNEVESRMHGFHVRADSILCTVFFIFESSST